MQQRSYTLVDSGSGRKLEQFGPYLLDRPCAYAVWNPSQPQAVWDRADAIFTREGENRWVVKRKLPDEWHIEVSNILFKLSITDFGHLGIFPEQADSWTWIHDTVKKAVAKRNDKVNVLNLFAYSGGSTLAAALGGAQVCHLDASKGMVTWARDNAILNKLENAPIRWIVDDVQKFLAREIKRGVRYDGIILDPPSFGRGSRGEVFKIEDDLLKILEDCRALLSDHPLFMLFSCHSAGFSPLVMQHLLSQTTTGLKGSIEVGEMCLNGESGTFDVPSGVFARWSHAN